MGYMKRSRRNTWYLLAILGVVVVALITLILIRSGVINFGSEANGDATPTIDLTASAEITPAPGGNLTPSAPITAPTAGTPLVTATIDTPVHNTPVEDSTIIARLSAGQSANVSGINSSGDWWQIQVPGEAILTGWVKNSDVIAENIENVPIVDPGEQVPPEETPSPERDAFVTANTNVNIRSQPNIIGEILGLLETGSTARVIGISTSRNWWCIELPDDPQGKGFVFGELVTAENAENSPVVDDNCNPVAGELPIPTPPPNSPNLTALVNVNIRSQPNTQSDLLGLLIQGQKAQVVGRNSDGSWWAIYIPSADQGRAWVSADFVITENTDEVPVIDG